MTALELARLQFAVTTLFHFIFVPLSIGLALFTAIAQTRWHRTGDERYLRMTRFFGKLLLISFAVGVATGIVQEFQFGMNWSQYSRYVGDVFGAPLAMEGLAAFFIESTFLGLWMFGWNRIHPRLHLASIWMVSIGTIVSAYFILAANSWMQHPVGYKINPETGRAQLTSIFDVLVNPTVGYALGHTVLGAVATGAMVVIAISAYHLLRGRETAVFGSAIRIGLVLAAVAAVATATLGHFQGMLVAAQQPMKMAAAAAHYHTENGAGLSLFALGDLARDPGPPFLNVVIPKLESFLATGSFDGTFKGIYDLQRQYVQQFGPGDYVPIVAVAYWSFRVMIGAGTVMILLTTLGLWLVRKRRLETSPLVLRAMIAAAALPFVANSTGWILREVGRQPWVVNGLLRTGDGVSPHVGTAQILLTFLGFFALYGAILVIAGRIFVRIAKKGPAPEAEAPVPGQRPARPDLALTY
jgi:cytochrome d ubiquinol oxidase subunit I